MRFAIIADIHGNLEALNQVWQSIKHQEIDEILCLGDIVGYGPNPNECVERVRKMGAKTVVGNHDYALFDEAGLEHFNPLAQAAALWTKSVLKPENFQYLACLPFTVKLPGIMFVHGSPIQPRAFHYISDTLEALIQFRGFEERICFVGHSHCPGIFSSDGEVFKESVNLQEGQRYIINVGSVGQPRDNNPLACYGILDDKSLTFSLVRLQYHIKKTARKMEKARLPNFLSERLFVGI